MKNINVFLFLLFAQLSFAQITFNGCHVLFEDQDYIFEIVGTDMTGRNIYETIPIDGEQDCPGLGICEFRISWSTVNSRWEFIADDGNGDFSNPYLLYYNTTATTPNPPGLTEGTWVSTQMECDDLTPSNAVFTIITCPTLTDAPANVTIINSTCQPICTVSGGSITAPGTPCPSGSTIQYNVNSGGWLAMLPVYDQDGPAQSIETRCVCDIDDAVFSPSSTAVETMPGICTNPTASITGTNSIIIGATTTLSPTSGGTWASSDETVATVTNEGVVTGVSTGIATFIFTASTTGCSSLPTPEITVIAGVAQIMGGSGFNTLQEAIDAAADGNTIILLQNISESDLLVSNSVIIDAGTFTLNASGLTIPSGKYMRWLNNTLTIPTGSVLSNMGTLWNNGSVTHADPFINAGTYKGTGTFNGTFTNNDNVSPGN